MSFRSSPDSGNLILHAPLFVNDKNSGGVSTEGKELPSRRMEERSKSTAFVPTDSPVTQKGNNEDALPLMLGLSVGGIMFFIRAVFLYVRIKHGPMKRDPPPPLGSTWD
ncbi:hypothetical protein GGTG_06063 [Gaeumannomyces tritici R3-111a-1]|uniref:Uncharacterized protein n=1 Tax=Gaeumannomyces tritici (strain R3-111a-1) TaxID=644352 RepID=J3NXQ8_GAET3|nr:hypothetical protein GGTG_06063 [Gaeumannomyces tritici R3-111a-1]EJT76140.1 hypothetical protein GGTG_06063 [Gaeumannomyces tritici R3-111a-1]